MNNWFFTEISAMMLTKAGSSEGKFAYRKIYRICGKDSKAQSVSYSKQKGDRYFKANCPQLNEHRRKHKRGKLRSKLGGLYLQAAHCPKGDRRNGILDKVALYVGIYRREAQHLTAERLS